MKMSTKRAVVNRPKNRTLAAPKKEALSYEKDFCKWTHSQASLLRKGELEKIDVLNLIEEIESLGRNDRRSLRSYLVVLLMHLLKQQYQSERKTSLNSWQSSILNSTREIIFLLEDSPSLRLELINIYNKAYERARKDASIETGLKLETFPEECPWTVEDLFPIIKKKSKKN
jgi:Domain of unknown function DUF29